MKITKTQGLIIVLMLFGAVAIGFQFDKTDIKLYRDGKVIATSDWIIESERTWFALDSYYDEKVKCPKIEALGGYRTDTRCYYPEDYYERIKRSLIGTGINVNGNVVTKATPYYKYGTSGAYAGKLTQEMIFEDTNIKEEFPNSFEVVWSPKDTRNYKLIWRLKNLKNRYDGGEYHNCNYKFGNVRVDLMDNCKDLDKVVITGDTALFYFNNKRGEQELYLMFVDPEDCDYYNLTEGSFANGWYSNGSICATDLEVAIISNDNKNVIIESNLSYNISEIDVTFNISAKKIDRVYTSGGTGFWYKIWSDYLNYTS
jgi:hypothetical protein